MKVAVYRKERFNSAHRLYNPNWSEEKNNEVFGLCNNPEWHGHNYDLHVKVVGEIDPETGFCINLDDLKQIIRRKVTKRFDHKNLNEDVEEFANLIPTAENIAYVIYQLIREELDEQYQLQIRLYETPRNYVEYPVEMG